MLVKASHTVTELLEALSLVLWSRTSPDQRQHDAHTPPHVSGGVVTVCVDTQRDAQESVSETNDGNLSLIRSLKNKDV